MLLGDKGAAGGAAGVLGWGRRCWSAAGRRRSFTGRWHQWQGLLGCCWVLLGHHQLLGCCWALLGPQLGFLLIPCCSDWSADGLGKPDVVASEVLRDVRPPLRGPRVEDQFPVAPVRRVSTLAAPPWICKFEFLKLADGAFGTRTSCTVGLHPARAALAEACFCVPCAVDAVSPAVILVLQDVAAPFPRHQGEFQVDE